MDLKVLIYKALTLSHNIFFNYIALFSFLFFLVGGLCFLHFHEKSISLFYYPLLLAPIFYGCAFGYQLIQFIRKKITLEGYVFQGFLINLHTNRKKSFYDNLFPLLLVIMVSCLYLLGLICLTQLVDEISAFWNNPQENNYSVILSVIMAFIYISVNFISFKLLKDGNELLMESIIIKNAYCLKHGISDDNSVNMTFTLYNADIIHVMFDNLIVNVKTNTVIYKKKKYNNTALHSYLSETGLSVKELSSEDWSVVAFMSI